MLAVLILIKPVKVARNLGVWFDSHFSMSTHISMSCSAAFFWLHNIKRISQFLPRDKLEMVLLPSLQVELIIVMDFSMDYRTVK